MGQRVCAFDILIEIASCPPAKMCPFPVLGHFPFHHTLIALSFSKHFNFCHLGEKNFFNLHFLLRFLCIFKMFTGICISYCINCFFFSCPLSTLIGLFTFFLFILIHSLWKEINHLTYVLWIFFLSLTFECMSF